MERKDNSTRRTHGVLLYASDSLNLKRRYDLEDDKLDCLWCEVRQPKSKPSLVGSVYRSPNSDALHLSDFQDNLSKALSSDLETFVLGDVNLDFLSKPRLDVMKQFKQFTQSLFCTK